MKKTLILMVTLITLSVAGQINPTEEAQPIVAEGKMLYKSEMASWYGTDLFTKNYANKSNIGGYFSYTEDDTSKCVFFSKAEKPKIIGTISFDRTYNVKTAKTDLTERDFTANENEIFIIRQITLEEIKSDSLFRFYQNSNLNIIPLIYGKVKKVYVITGPQEMGVVLFGNDYLLTFDKNNKLLEKKKLHNNLIPIIFADEKEGVEVEGSMHNHSADSGDFITATDICTLMLYARFTNWKTHNVISEKYLNIWNCETNELTVVPIGTVKKIVEDQEKRK